MKAPKAGSPPPLEWAIAMMADAGVTPKVLARTWGVDTSEVSRWLNGWTGGRRGQDTRLSRVAAFSVLVRRPIAEIIGFMGLQPWSPADGEAPEKRIDRAVPLGTITVQHVAPGEFDLLLNMRVSTRQAETIMAKVGELPLSPP